MGLCILPTVGLFAWGMSRHSAWHVDGHAERLSNALALTVTLDGVEHPRPGVLRYQGVRAADPETGETVFSCRRVEASSCDVQDSPRPALVLTVERAEICPRQGGRLWRLLQHVMARRAGDENIDVRMLAAEIALQADKAHKNAGKNAVATGKSAPGAVILRGVQASVQTVADGGQAEFKFHVGERTEIAPVQIHVKRDRTTQPPSITFDVIARDEPIPCSLFAPWPGDGASLGEQSRFQGYFFARYQGNESWQGRIVEGKLSGLDLGRIFQQRFPNVLSGQATLVIERADFAEGRLKEAAGSVAAGPGAIGREFFDSAREKLHLRSVSLPADSSDQLPYESLSFAFTIGREGLLIRGTVAARNGFEQTVPILMADANGPILSEPSEQPLPLAALLHALVPESRGQMSPSERADWLTRRLPASESGESRMK